MKDELLITPGHCKEQIGYLTVSDPSDGDPVVLAATPRYDRKGRIFPPSSPPFQSGYYYPTKEQTTANLSLYAEAHNVYNETKISPRQMEQEITRLREQVEQRITVEQAMEVVKGLALEKTNTGWGDRVLISLDTLHASLTKAAKP